MGSLSLKHVLYYAGEEAKDPCLPVGYSRAAPAGTVVGSGSFEECRAIAKGLIAGQCQDDLCPIGDSMPVELQGTAWIDSLQLSMCCCSCASGLPFVWAGYTARCVSDRHPCSVLNSQLHVKICVMLIVGPCALKANNEHLW